MKTKPKLWIVNQYATTPEYPASSRHYELSKYLSGVFDVTLWGCNFVHHNKTFRFSKWTLFKKERIENFDFVWLGAIAYRGNSFGRMLNMVLFAFWLLVAGIFKPGRPNIVIGSSPTLFAAFSCMLIANVRRARFVLEIRDLWPDTFIEINGKQDGWEIRFMKWMERVLYRRADIIITLTQDIRNRLKNRGIPEEKIHFVPNGIDINTLHSVHSMDLNIIREKLRDHNGFSREDFVFMYAGNHGPSNSLEQLIDAMIHLKSNSHLKLVLMGDGAQKQWLMERTRKNQLENSVIFLSAVPKSEVMSYLSIADAFIISLKNIPLFHGALPNKLFDYVLMNKPVLTTVKGEILEFLDQYGAGYYGNMSEAGETFLPVVMERIAAERKHPIMDGYTLINNNYNRERQARELSLLLQSLLEKRSLSNYE